MKFSKLLLVAAIGAASSGTVLAATEQNQASDAILLQGFHWHSHSSTNWYQVIEDNAGSIGDLGISHVWFPPPSDAASDEGYLPRQLNLLTSRYGNEGDLSDAIDALHANGVNAVADVVINHRVGTTNWADFTNPTWGSWAVASNDEWTGATGNYDTGDSYGAARDLNHVNTTVQNDIMSWMTNRLGGVGFSGIRYDYSKGYDPYYAGLYARAMNPDFCVGEVWTDLNYDNVNAHRQLLVDYIDGTDGDCGVFDFTTKGLLNRALQNNEYGRLSISNAPAGGIGWWPQKMVTFVDNHDTGPSENCNVGQNHWPVPCDKVMQGYAYILTHPGIPTVYWAHAYNWNLYSAIKILIDIRKDQGLTSTSSVAIQAATNGLYAAIIDGKVAMKIGPNAWSPSGTGWQVAASGSGYAVWTKDTQPPPDEDWQRTVILIYGQTSTGQDMFIRGGIDHNYAASALGKTCTATNYECAIPIRHNNLRNATTTPWKTNDSFLDWYGVQSGQSSAAQGSPADWTTDIWPSSWGTVRTVAVDGYGVEPLNTYGQHYWMLDVEMDCNRTVDGWFEIKTFISNGPGWEPDIAQAGTPYSSGNHFAQCGRVSVFQRGNASVQFKDY